MTRLSMDPQCREVVELVTEYLSHALTAAEYAAFETHLLSCAPCTIYLDQIKTVLTLAGALEKPPPSQLLERELLDLFLRWHDGDA